MNRNVQRILCFGDSNTWGFNPRDGSRFDHCTRWTALLQHKLGHEFCVIEEGLNGRTTDLHYANRLGKCGREYLIPCLDSHYPINFVILNLGANDMKYQFGKSAIDIARSLYELIDIILGHSLERPSRAVKVLLVVPTRILEQVGTYADGTFLGAQKKSEELAHILLNAQEKESVYKVDLFNQIEPSPFDGVHLSIDAHEKVAEIMKNNILSRAGF